MAISSSLRSPSTSLCACVSLGAEGGKTFVAACVPVFHDSCLDIDTNALTHPLSTHTHTFTHTHSGARDWFADMPFEVLGHSLRNVLHLDDCKTIDLLMVCLGFVFRGYIHIHTHTCVHIYICIHTSLSLHDHQFSHEVFIYIYK